MQPLVLAAVSFLAVALLACDGQVTEVPGAPSVDSGIVGTVTISPVRGGPIRPGDADAAPYAATLTLLSPEGLIIAQERSGESGQFRMLVPPGDYILRPESPGRLPRAAEQAVRVESGRITEVTVQYDSGMR